MSEFSLLRSVRVLSRVRVSSLSLARARALQSTAACALIKPNMTAQPARSICHRTLACSPTSSTSSSSVRGIPVIDLSGTFGSGESVAARRALVAKQLDEACREIGFITIQNHGVPIQLIEQTWKVTQDYFDLPPSFKSQIPLTKAYPYGYSGFGEEQLAKGYGDQVTQPDPKESFCIGPSNPKAAMPARMWPAQPTSFQPLWTQYYENMEKLAQHMLGLMALALGVKEDFFNDKIDRHRSALRALNYPALDRPLAPNQVRAGQHTDYGSITILLQDSTGGLQVLNRDKIWVNAVPMKNTFVINLGDLLARWTNDRWVSTLHRVVQPPSGSNAPPARRQSMAFFHNVNEDTMIQCIETCKGPGNPPKYQPKTAWELLIEKHEKSMKY